MREAQNGLAESSMKLELMRMALEDCLGEMDPVSHKARVLKEELDELLNPSFISPQRLSHSQHNKVTYILYKSINYALYAHEYMWVTTLTR